MNINNLDIIERKLTGISLTPALQGIIHHLENSPLATVGWDREFRVTFWSQRAESMFGWTTAEVMGKTPFDWQFVFEADREQVDQTTAQSLKGDSTVCHNRNYRKDGSVIFCEWYNSALLDDQGNLVSLLSFALDVTDRKQAEAALQASEARFRRYERIVSATADAVSLVDRQYRYQIVNQTYLDWFQKSYTDIVGHSVSELLGQKVFETVVQPRVDRCFAGETVQYNEWFELPALGRQFLSLTYSPYREVDQTISGVVVSAHNITSLKQVEEAIRQSEQRFQEIAQTISQFFFIRSAITGEFIYISPAYERIWGRSCESLYQNPDSWLEDIYPDDRPLVNQSLSHQLAENSVQREYRIIQPDGAIRWIYAQINLVRDEFGNPLHFVGFAKDISDRKAAELALQQSEALYLTILEDQTELITRFQPDGTLLFVNDALCRYYGVSRDDIIGNLYQPLIYPADQPAIDRCLAALTPANPVGNVEHRVFVNGTVRWMQWTNRAIYDPQGNLLELQSVGRDIDDRKQAELKVQAALAEKEVLLQEIYHRVKNNLQLILSLLQMQQRRLKHSEAVQALQDSWNRVMTISLVHEILYQSDNLAQIDLSQYIPTLVQHIAASYHLTVPAVQVKTDVQSIILPMKKALCCGLILNELVTNSLKYAFPSRKAGQIMVAVQIDQTQPEHTITMTVKDDGIGLPQSTELSGVATLGLTLVQDFVDQLRGAIIVESSQGCLFRVTFRQKS